MDNMNSGNKLEILHSAPLNYSNKFCIFFHILGFQLQKKKLNIFMKSPFSIQTSNQLKYGTF